MDDIFKMEVDLVDLAAPREAQPQRMPFRQFLEANEEGFGVMEIASIIRDLVWKGDATFAVAQGMEYKLVRSWTET